MIGWGSWANTQKLAGKERWPFELVYWDYSAGVAIGGVLFLITLGMAGSSGMSSFANLRAASAGAISTAIAAGALVVSSLAYRRTVKTSPARNHPVLCSRLLPGYRWISFIRN